MAESEGESTEGTGNEESGAEVPTGEPAESAEERSAALGAGDEGGEETTPAANWRDSITDPELRKVAERFNTNSDMAKAVVDLRKASSAPRLPGKDATDEERAAWRKEIGVPDGPDGYTFEMPEGREVTDSDKAFQSKFAEVFHGAEISTAQARALTTAWNEMTIAAEDAMRKADEDFVKSSTAALQAEWGDDHDRNVTLANRAAVELFGDGFEEAKHMEMKDGRFLLDDPRMLKMLANAGSEMAEGRIGPRVSESDRASLNEQIDDLQNRKMAALGSGNRKEAQRLDQEQAKLIEKSEGSQPVVGSEGRSS